MREYVTAVSYSRPLFLYYRKPYTNFINGYHFCPASSPPLDEEPYIQKEALGLTFASKGVLELQLRINVLPKIFQALGLSREDRIRRKDRNTVSDQETHSNL